jgi:protein-disulfide isomerase
MSNETLEPTDNSSPAPASSNRNWIPVVAGLAFFLLGLGAGYLIWGSNLRFSPLVSSDQAPGNKAAAAAAIANQQPTQEIQIPENIKRFDIVVDEDDSIWGVEDAPITIVEFSDYECPFCQKWYLEVLSPLMEEYPDQIRFVYKDFPLAGLHSEAVGAAIAANCAGEQDAYWAYHNALFDGQYGLGAEAYQKYADDMGLNKKAFAQCLEEERYRDEVMADYEYAAEMGVQSTPTFFLNGIPIVGAQPYDLFKQVVELELAGKIPNQ